MSTPLLLLPLSANALLVAGDEGSSALGTAIYVGDLDGVPRSWLLQGCVQSCRMLEKEK